MAAYMATRGDELAGALAAFQLAVGVSDAELQAAKPRQMLEKKWTSVVRLQRKVMNLEAEVAKLEKQVKAGGGAALRGEVREEWLPEDTAKHRMALHRGVVAVRRVGVSRWRSLTLASQCVAFHPIYAQVASGSEDTSVKLWDAESGSLECTLKGHTSAVNGVAYHPAGNLIASCSNDLSVKLWSTETHTCVRTLVGHDHAVSCVAFLPDGRALASGSRDGTVRLWDATTGFCTLTLRGHTEWVKCLAVSPTGTALASGGVDQSVIVWQLPAGVAAHTLRGHSHVVEAVAFSTPGADAGMRRARAKAQLIEAAARGEESKAGSATGAGAGSGSAVAEGGELVASCSRDKSVRVWAAASGDCLMVLEGHSNWVRGMVFHPRAAMLLSVSDDKALRVWDLVGRRCAKEVRGAHDHFVCAVAVHSTLPLVATGGVDTMVRLWEGQ